jgi:hypothetical protein
MNLFFEGTPSETLRGDSGASESWYGVLLYVPKGYCSRKYSNSDVITTRMLSDAYGTCIRHDPCPVRCQLMGRRCCRQRARPFLLSTLQGTNKFEKIIVNKTCKYMLMISNTDQCDSYLVYYMRINIHKGRDLSGTLINVKPVPYNHP